MFNETRCTCGEQCSTFGACMRRKNFRVGFCREAAGLDYTHHRNTVKELAAYKSARDQGVQPDGTRLAQTHKALDASDATGKAYGVDKNA